MLWNAVNPKKVITDVLQNLGSWHICITITIIWKSKWHQCLFFFFFASIQFFLEVLSRTKTNKRRDPDEILQGILHDEVCTNRVFSLSKLFFFFFFLLPARSPQKGTFSSKLSHSKTFGQGNSYFIPAYREIFVVHQVNPEFTKRKSKGKQN